MSRKSEILRRTNSPEGVPGFLSIFTDLKYRLILEGIGVGLLAGVLVSVFRLALSEADDIRTELIAKAKEDTSMLILCLVILAAITFALIYIMKKEPMCKGSGIVHVKGELKGKIKTHWYNVILAKFIGSVLAIGGGLSLGRQGPSVQLGAMAGKGFSRLSGRLLLEERLLVICGAGAGLSAAFGAPLSGVVFALEEFHKKFSAEVLLSTMAACITSDWVASSIYGLRPVFSLSVSNNIPLEHYWMLIIMGILLGMLGWIYKKGLLFFKEVFASIKKSWIKIAVPVAVVIIFAAFYPQVLGSGHELVPLVSQPGQGIKVLAVLLIIKTAFNMLSFGTAAPGGIFLPLLVAGAVAGSLYAQCIGVFMGCADTHTAYFVVLGMAGLFAAVVRAPVTGIILICEMTGIFNNMLPLAIVTLLAYVTAELMGAEPIYDKLLEEMIKEKGIKKNKKPINIE